MPDHSRRDVLRAGLLGAGAVSLGLVFWARRCAGPGPVPLAEAMGPLAEVADDATGLPLLRLPEGFRYRSFSWAGSRLHDGHEVPGRADGMGVVAQHASRVTLVRNHEMRGSSGAIGDPASAYDVTGGGTTTLVFDTATGQVVDSWVSLGGTLNNCAGGVTPWGSWLSCEEAPLSPALHHLPVPARQFFWGIRGARREHGFVFEVPAEGVARPEPIRAMGQFYHEAVAIDPRDGIAYMTEDTAPRAGFYRYLPDRPRQLAAGGRLQMMRVAAGRDMRDGLAVGDELPVDWVEIDQPTQGFTPGNREGDGVVAQGLAAGGSAFISLEGCAFHDGRIYFTSKLGGRANAGYVFEFDPGRQTVWLVYESPGHGSFSGPDNIVMSPRGSLVICEDRVNLLKAGHSLAGLRPDGTLFRFCQVNPRLRGQHGGHDLGATLRTSEWAGATFSRDGLWLFCNLYNPGVTFAITGPWRDGLI
jgi:hypothetical protein